jgi:radical SAM protein with 4Fe4S-binding SPASM domain
MTYHPTGSSKYKEINFEQRVKIAQKEIDEWGKEADKYRNYRYEWNRAANEDYLPAHPLHVDIELSSACNLRCRMCAHGIRRMNNVGLMDRRLALRLIDECADIGVYSIKFNWRGEVTLNSFLPEAVKYAKSKAILEVQINTNGLPHKENALILCAENGIDRIIFSVDGFSKETYEHIRIGGNYENLIKNIHRLINWKKELKTNKPLIRVQMVRTQANAHEVDDFIKYWQALVDDVRISDVMNRGQGNEMSVGDQVAVGRCRCPQPFQRLVVARDGLVSPCCADWYQEYVVGDAKRTGLLDIWNNDRISYIRRIQKSDQHDKIMICANCPVKESYVWKRRK